MTADLKIVGGTLATANGVYDGGLAIQNEKITAIGNEDALPAAEQVLDLEGEIVLPGVVDPHVHIDGFNSIDSYRSGTSAAALGGVTSVINFAWQTWNGTRAGNQRKVWEDSGSLCEAVDRQQQKATESGALVDYGLHATVTAEDTDVFDEFSQMIDQGVTSFKFFTAYDIALSNGFIQQAFERLADLGAIALVHPEDPSVCTTLTEDQRRAGNGSPTDYPSARPDYAEALAVSNTTTLAQETGCRYYAVHISSSKACSELVSAQQDGALIRGETCTHYISLTDDEYERQGTVAMQSPPLRTEHDIQRLFTALDQGELSVVSTDHVASTKASKSVSNWWECSFGINGLEFSLPVVYTEAVEKRGYPLPFLVRKMSANPARTFGLPDKGRLRVGVDADLVIFDPDETYSIDGDAATSKADYSVYDGREVTGRVKQTYVRGELIADEGNIVADPGYGSFLDREVPNWGG